MKFDFEKQAFIVQKFHETQRVIKVQRAWRTKYKFIDAPRANAIKSIVSRFEKTGSTKKKPLKRLEPTILRKQAIIDVENLVSEFPKLSLKMISGECQISRKLSRKVLKQDLGRKPYKIPMYHQIKPGDYQKRVEFAEWFLRIPQAKSEYLIVSDEAYFYLTESLNKQNNRIWETERPTDGIEKPLHSEKLLVFFAISATKIYGPYYFST